MQKRTTRDEYNKVTLGGRMVSVETYTSSIVLSFISLPISDHPTNRMSRTDQHIWSIFIVMSSVSSSLSKKAGGLIA